jgi:triphosphoribosyl-dephospho-CoA synthase
LGCACLRAEWPCPTAMRRHANGDWRTNVAQGAKAEPFQLTPQLEELALRASAAVGTWAAGVDLLRNNMGEWFVIEVNAVPGWKAIAPTTGVDVAKALLLTLQERIGVSVSNAATPNSDTARDVYLACRWEATAKKAGNVHPTASFADVNYTDFVVSGAAIAPVLAEASRYPLGETICRAIQATRQVVRTNTNLGIVLLLAPLAKVPDGIDLRIGLQSVLANTTVGDAEWVYEAIRLAIPGGLGKAESQDVHDTPTQTLREVMALAADRDLIAKQYANNFAEIFEFGVPCLLEGLRKFGTMEAAILDLQLHFLANYPDSLIARKLGFSSAQQVAERARTVLNLGSIGTEAGRNAYDELDGWLRSDGHRKNPGTTADLITACLYVALRSRMVDPQMTM